MEKDLKSAAVQPVDCREGFEALATRYKLPLKRNDNPITQACGVEYENEMTEYLRIGWQAALKRESGGLIDALEFYANDKNYNSEGVIIDRYQTGRFVADKGDRAKAALSKSEDAK